MPEFVEDDTLEQTRKRCKWENNDYICRGHILNEDASSKKFLVSNFNNYKMVDSRAKKSSKGKGKDIAGSSLVNMIEDGKNKNNKKNNKAKKRKNDGNNDGSNKNSKLTCWKCGKTGHFKKDFRVKNSNGGNTSGSGQISKDPNSSQGNKKYEVTFIDDPSRFCYVYLCHAKDEALDKFKIYKTKVDLQQNDLIKILQSRDPMFDEKRFTSIPRPKSLMPSSNDDQIGETPVETPIIRRSNRARVAKSFVYDLQLYLVEGSRAMQSRDVAFWKEATNDEMDSIMENNTWIVSDLPPVLGFHFT
nr:hypothetical protein [Tanacetum cinerariifolium]